MTTPAMAAYDAMTITRRNLIKYLRVPNLIVFSTVQPVMFVLLFAYVFGGAIKAALPRGVHYIDFLMPGIVVQTVVFGSTQTGVGLADDMTKGIIDRFRSLPIARSAVLAGRTISDTVRNLGVVLLMVTVGTLIGFRIHTGVVPAFAALVVALGFGFAMSWISATIGLMLRDVETAQSASFVWIFPLVFASTVFVPLKSMPGWLQAFARANPITNVANALRALTLGGATTRPLVYALAWLTAILVTFAPLATRRYRKVA
ncbi:MAG TPA: ABC transporter permease [Acidimicrobiales bacterium]|nr:ABC transporter permease [Acidimicrobiales bacterium]